ncbi:hypothetical protein SKAU_G00247860 [Synaphobranchus kaupii]|uniref:Uncharacterized protein n=1 Tax=Synaphobranchus kaupii TaxID=118154 RepID=A0A9Q1IQN2_SYNKA|nr:hypothetical protein SKAU_G00247860 [Synaphobranchus kaupii]
MLWRVVGRAGCGYVYAVPVVPPRARALHLVRMAAHQPLSLPRVERCRPIRMAISIRVSEAGRQYAGDELILDVIGETIEGRHHTGPPGSSRWWWPECGSR